MTAILDHIVINARFEMDGAEKIFTSMGFLLTPLGRHTLGSINHLAMFQADYLELVGIAEADTQKRPEIGKAPSGLNALVFKSDNVDTTFARLEALGLAGDPPQSFSRPVTLSDGSTHDAAFRTVTARAEACPAGRLYFCEHLTPDLVWRDEWLTHPNGATGFCELVIVTPTPDEDAARMAGLLEGAVEPSRPGGVKIHLDTGFHLVFETLEIYNSRFGDMARDAAGRETFLGAMGLNCASMGVVRDVTAGNPYLRVREGDGSITVAVDTLDTLLVFEA